MGLFDRLLPPTDHVDEIVSLARAEQDRIATERYNQRRINNVQGQSTYTNERSRHMATQRELRRVQEENRRLREVGAKVFADRAALVNTINYLSSKWLRPDQEQEFLHEAQDVREKEFDKLNNDKDFVDGFQNKVTNTKEDWVPAQSMRVGKTKKNAVNKK